jgi:hypothetical protein
MEGRRAQAASFAASAFVAKRWASCRSSFAIGLRS